LHFIDLQALSRMKNWLLIGRYWSRTMRPRVALLAGYHLILQAEATILEKRMTGERHEITG
jgi:hypothetical protein